MFGFGKKKSPTELIREALEKSDLGAAEKAARVAFDDPESSEHTLAWAAAAMYERQIHSGLGLLQTFVERFPRSLHLPSVYLADLMARSSRYDAATDLARGYLRNASDAGILAQPLKEGIIREGVAKAFLLLTAAYTEMGARSYSARVLKRAQAIGFGQQWDASYRQELGRLAEELHAPDNRQADVEWEAFFAGGQNADLLYNRCKERGFPILAKRIDLLESNFRFNARFAVDEREQLLLLLTTEKNEMMLA